MSDKITAVTRVQITIEVDASAWGGECSIGQLYEQAGKEAVATLYRTLNNGNCPHRIIGEPKVIGVITSKP